MLLQLIYKTKKRIVHPNRLKKFIKNIVKKMFNNKQILKNLELNFIFVDNKKMTKLNKIYLNKNFPTDVLCFKYDKFTADIIISTQEVIKNARLYKTLPFKELLFVLVHGLLHFKGMRDNTVKGQQAMYSKAEKLISEIRL